MALKLSAEDAQKLVELPFDELEYCLKLIKRFEVLHIDGAIAGRAVSTMLQRGVVVR